MVFKNGERLVGHMLKAHGGSVTFKSDSLGEVNVDWSKIQELHTAGNFAVLDKGVKLNGKSDTSKVPQGKISVADQTVTVTPASGAPVTVAVAETAHIVDEASFQKSVLHNPGFFEGWNGAVTAGASLVEATQTSHTFTGSLNFVRAIPTENWLAPRNRTIFDFTASDGVITQPGTPEIRTEIVHADLERDQYFSDKNIFGFGQAMFDHNYSQGLNLQQTYSGGLGWTAIKRANTTLDFKGSLSYTKQNFTVSASNHNLIGTVLSESYAHKLGKGVQFLEQLSVTPSFNQPQAYSATASSSLTLPVYKRLAFAVSLLDSFLNDPPPGFKKNSFQLTTGITYTLK